MSNPLTYDPNVFSLQGALVSFFIQVYQLFQCDSEVIPRLLDHPNWGFGWSIFDWLLDVFTQKQRLPTCKDRVLLDRGRPLWMVWGRVCSTLRMVSRLYLLRKSLSSWWSLNVSFFFLIVCMGYTYVIICEISSFSPSLPPILSLCCFRQLPWNSSKWYLRLLSTFLTDNLRTHVAASLHNVTSMNSLCASLIDNLTVTFLLENIFCFTALSGLPRIWPESLYADFDLLKDVGTSNNASTVFMNHSPGMSFATLSVPKPLLVDMYI